MSIYFNFGSSPLLPLLSRFSGKTFLRPRAEKHNRLRRNKFSKSTRTFPFFFLLLHRRRGSSWRAEKRKKRIENFSLKIEKLLEINLELRKLSSEISTCEWIIDFPAILKWLLSALRQTTNLISLKIHQHKTSIINELIRTYRFHFTPSYASGTQISLD